MLTFTRFKSIIHFEEYLNDMMLYLICSSNKDRFRICIPDDVFNEIDEDHKIAAIEVNRVIDTINSTSPYYTIANELSTPNTLLVKMNNNVDIKYQGLICIRKSSEKVNAFYTCPKAIISLVESVILDASEVSYHVTLLIHQLAIIIDVGEVMDENMKREITISKIRC